MARGWTSRQPEVEAIAAPEALAGMLPDVRQVTLLVTDQALPFAKHVERRLGKDVVTIEPHELGDTAAEQQKLFRLVSDVLGRYADHRVIIDVTQGLRHLPLVYFAASAFREGNSGHAIDGAYYAMFEVRGDGPVPVVDLAPMLSMHAWGRALERARVSADWRGVAERFAVEVEVERAEQENSLTRRTRRMAEALRAGLPLEAGMEAKNLGASLGRLVEPDPRAEAKPLTETVREAAGPLGKLVASLSAASTNKRSIRLERDELDRQLRVAEALVSVDGHTAALLLREWMVNRALFEIGSTGAWLDRRERLRAERALWLADRSSAVGTLWRELALRRNPMAHVGMTLGVVHPPDLARMLERCRALLDVRLPALHAPERLLDVLVTPLGLSPGVLHTLLRARGPFDALVIVTSMAARPGGEEVLKRLSYGGGRMWIELADAMTSDDLSARAGERQAEFTALFRSATRVVVNTTGGTSLLQHVVSALGALAERVTVDAARVEWVATFDRRPPEVSRADPLGGGEVAALPRVFAGLEGE